MANFSLIRIAAIADYAQLQLFLKTVSALARYEGSMSVDALTEFVLRAESGQLEEFRST